MILGLIEQIAHEADYANRAGYSVVVVDADGVEHDADVGIESPHMEVRLRVQCDTVKSVSEFEKLEQELEEATSERRTGRHGGLRGLAGTGDART